MTHALNASAVDHAWTHILTKPSGRHLPSLLHVNPFAFPTGCIHAALTCRFTCLATRLRHPAPVAYRQANPPS